MKILVQLLASIALLLLTIGCTSRPTSHGYGAVVHDPYESCNRKVFVFNSHVDHLVLRPIAITYVRITPPIVRTGVTHFFSNVDLITTLPNDLLQGKVAYAVSDSWRFIINTTVGVGGLFDVASGLGIPPHHEDFGLTLAQWGIVQQPYLVLPLLGPSTPRDAIGLIADYAASPWPYITPWWIPTSLIALRTVNTRANLLAADPILRTAFDPYAFVRDAYIQSRQKQINDNHLTYDQYVARYRYHYSGSPDSHGDYSHSLR